MNSLADLRKRIQDKTARLAVVGMGYVGLSVAVEFASAGFDVRGVELRAERVELINQGRLPMDGNEPGLAEALTAAVTSHQLRVTTDYAQLATADVIILAVETPVDDQHIPRYEALRAALLALGPVLQPGVLVIIESTIAPGTMDQIVRPLLETSSRRTVNQDLYLGNCPERVMPGKLLVNLRHVSRVVGGMNPETAETMVALYQHIVHADLDVTDCVTAELVKTVENAYRDVQIAFANEVALICEAVGGDVWQVRTLVNKSPYRQMHLPGAGVGGHCIPKDPWLLVSNLGSQNVPVRLIPAARAINDSMPHHMAELVGKALAEMGRSMGGARILVLGYAYLEDSGDTRNSPSVALVELLRLQGAHVIIHDPYIAEYHDDLKVLANDCDAVILMVRHKPYLELDWGWLKSLLRTPILIDGRGIVDPGQAIACGLHLWTIGHGGAWTKAD